MADSTSPITQIASGQSAKEVTANGNFDQTSPAALYGRNPLTTTGLTWGYMGGRLDGTAVASGTVALTNTATNYVVAHRTTGAVTASTATTNWDNTATYARLYKVVCAAGVVSSYEDWRTCLNPPPTSNLSRELQVACSDLTTALTTGAGKAVLRAPRAMTITGVRASLAVAQASGSIFTVDINEAGTSILSTKLTIDNTEKTSTTAATPAVVSDSAIADDAEITVDIDQVGDGTAKGLVVTILYQ